MRSHETDRRTRASRGAWRGLLPCGFAVACWFCGGAVPAVEWVWQNPRPAPSYTWGAVSFSDSQIGMILGYTGTILRTEDGGVTWSDVDAEGAIDEFLCGHLFAEERCGISVIDSDTATIVGFDGSGHFIGRTEDGGRTWSRQGADLELPTGTTLMDVSFVNVNDGIAVGWNLAASVPVLLRTTDGGETWNMASEVDGVSVIAMWGVTSINADTALAVGSGGNSGQGDIGERILRTTDGGDTWTTVYADGGGHIQRLKEVTCPDVDTCFAVGGVGEILKSSDGGLNWVSQDSGSDEPLLSITCSDASTCIVTGGLGTFNDRGRAILRTSDGGATWDTVVFEESGAPLVDVAFHGPSAVAAVGRAGLLHLNERGGSILRSIDGGTTWDRQTLNLVQNPDAEAAMGMVFTSVAFDDPATGLAVGHVTGGGGLGKDSGVVLRTIDGGNTWADRTPASLLSLHDVTFVDSETAYIAGGGQITNVGACPESLLLQSTDGGSTWNDLTQNLPSDPYVRSRTLRAAHFTDASTGTIVGGVFRVSAECDHLEGPVILRTTDGGSTWSVQGPSQEGSPFIFYDVYFTNTSTGVVVGREGTILRTSDGGATWTSQDGGAGATLRGVFFIDEDHGWIVGDGIVLETTDGGVTWTNKTPSELPTRVALHDVKFGDANNGIITGAIVTINGGEVGGLLLRTTDGGVTWTLEQGKARRIGETIRSVELIDPEAAVLAGADFHAGVLLRSVPAPTFLPLDLRPHQAEVCGDSGGEVTVVAGIGSVGEYVGTVSVATAGEPMGVISELEPSSVVAPGSTTWTLTAEADVAPGQHTISLIGDDGADQHSAEFLLDVIGAGQTPMPIAPENEAIEIGLQPKFSWEAVPGVDQYRVQIATDEGFGNVVLDEEVGPYPTFTSSIELVKDAQYFWRVQGIHDCLDGVWSEVFSFTTVDLVPELATAPEAIGFEVEVGSGESATLDVTNMGSGDLTWNIETAELPVTERRNSSGGDSGRAAIAPRRDVTGASLGAVDLASTLGEPLPGVRAVVQSDGLVNCDDELGLLVHDDGTVENGYTGAAGQVDLVTYVDRFTPNVYPASFSRVCVAFLTLGPTSLEFEIVVFDDDGPEGGPGTELGALSVSADGIPGDIGTPVWFSLDISALGVAIESGSAYIGVRWAPSSPNVFVASDESPENPPGFAGGYTTTDNTEEWAPIEGAFPDYRSLFVRAVEIPAGCQDPTNLPWLTITPNAGSVPPGTTTAVTVRVDATIVGTGTYSANLCLHSNDPDRPLVGVPVDVNVVGSELTLDTPGLDFGNVFVDTTSAPQVVTLHNGGNLDATGLAFQLTGNGFEADTGACGATLAVGASCQVSVAFTPTESGPTEGTLQATSDTGLPVVLSLTGNGVRETEVFTPMGLEVDLEPIISDANGVFEPGELAPVAPVWRHDGVAPQDVTGTASDLTGPEGPTYSLLAADAEYGHIEPGATAGCQESEACYEMDIGPAGVPRPAPHWDATFQEVLSDDTSHTWTLHIGDSFVDVPRSSPFYPSVEALLHSGVTGGCTETEYCPAGLSSRAQMPVFMLKALEGSDYQPSACHEGAPTFADVPIDSPFCPWIKDLAERGVISGCGDGNYCPTKPVTRAQMAIFLLKTLEGEEYTPPACTGEFVDVPCSSAFAAWVEELAARGITGGCSADPPAYCPVTPVTRVQMATFVTRTFGLTLYGP